MKKAQTRKPIARLCLSLGPPPELEKITFFHPILETDLISVRGRTCGALPQCGTFPWSNAVRAITTLIVGTKVHHLLAKEPFRIEGEKGSLATSLDYALGKQPHWIEEMFGADSQGRIIARRLLLISNSCRKRRGPVVISLNQEFLNPSYISICDATGDEISEKILLKLLRELLKIDSKNSLESAIQVHFKDNSSEVDKTFVYPPNWMSIFQEPNSKNHLKHEFFKEIHKALRHTHIFAGPTRFRGELSALHNHEYFIGLAGRNKQVVSDIDLSLSTGSRFGALDEAVMRANLCKQDPIRFAVGPGGVTSILIVRYLQKKKNYNIQLNYKFANSQDITAQIVAGTFGQIADAVILSPTCAARLLSRKTTYSPLMVMPGTSNQIVVAKGGDPSLDGGDYVFMTDSPSSATFFYDDLQRSGLMRSPKAHKTCLEPDEVIGHLAEEQNRKRAILWWPYYMFQEMFDVTEPIKGVNDKWSFYLTSLFVHESLIKDSVRATCFDVAIRNAWLALQVDTQFIIDTVNELFDDQEYLSFLGHCNGLHTLPRTPLNIFAPETDFQSKTTCF